MKNPFTTATSIGVTTRYLTVAITSAVTVAAFFGAIDDEQRNALTEAVPQIVGAVSSVLMVVTMLYGIFTKSVSDRMLEASKEVDKSVPPAMPIEIKTPPGIPDIQVKPDTK